MEDKLSGEVAMNEATTKKEASSDGLPIPKDELQELIRSAVQDDLKAEAEKLSRHFQSVKDKEVKQIRRESEDRLQEELSRIQEDMAERALSQLGEQLSPEEREAAKRQITADQKAALYDNLTTQQKQNKAQQETQDFIDDTMESLGLEKNDINPWEYPSQTAFLKAATEKSVQKRLERETALRQEKEQQEASLAAERLRLEREAEERLRAEAGGRVIPGTAASSGDEPVPLEVELAQKIAAGEMTLNKVAARLQQR